MVRKEEYPEVGELVVCTVRDVKRFGAFVVLDEYSNKEGFIHITEVASGWIKYIRDHIREGQKIVCKVLNVDESKGHVDLSLKQVNAHQRREKIQQWKNEQKAEKLFEILARKLGRNVDACYNEFGYRLIDTFGTLYGAFEDVVVNPEILEENGFEGEWVEHFIEIAKENIQPPFVCIDGIIELTCPRSDGIVHIKKALERIENTKNVQITTQYLGAPRYRILVSAPDYKTAEEEFKNAAERAVAYITECGGEGKYSRRK